LDLWSALTSLPEQLAAAPGLVAGSTLPAARWSNVVIVDETDGGLAARVVAAVALEASAVPVVAAGPPAVPAFVGPGTLVLVLSATGEGLGIVESAEAALGRGAAVVAITAPGPLAETCARAGTVVGLEARGPARAALGWMTAVPLVVLERLELVPEALTVVEAASAGLTRRRDQLAAGVGGAAEVARRIGRTFPLVHGPPGLVGLAAWRWVAAVNENAKSPCFAASAEQLGGDGLAGFGQHGDVTRQVLTLVNLRHPGEGAETARRVAAVNELLLEVVADIIDVEGRGESDLARFYDLALVGDVVSLHLAAREQVDPGPVPVREDLRRALGAPPR
jgi:glucose/mannose-6-phosphate isomerase